MKDRFSQHAEHYAQFRPVYPPELYDFIYQHVKEFDKAWDAGTGNGQCARVLSQRFKQVYATDISAKQIAHAFHADNILYSIAGEQTTFADNSISLITVAQAAHWFDMKRFSDEVKRVAKNDSVIALWGYSLLSIATPIDEMVELFYRKVIGSYWDAERRHIDEHFTHLYFPFQEISSPLFHITVSWTMEEFAGYINTWSAVQKYISTNQHNPVEELIKQIEPHWKESKQTVKFPLFLKLGIIHK